MIVAFQHYQKLRNSHIWQCFCQDYCFSFCALANQSQVSDQCIIGNLNPDTFVDLFMCEANSAFVLIDVGSSLEFLFHNNMHSPFTQVKHFSISVKHISPSKG